MNSKNIEGIGQYHMSKQQLPTAIVDENEEPLKDLQAVADSLNRIQGADSIKKKTVNVFNRLLIKIDSPTKAQFDNVMILVSTYNVFS